MPNVLARDLYCYFCHGYHHTVLSKKLYFCSQNVAFVHDLCCRSRQFDRDMREREAEIQWDRDRSVERQFGLANSRLFDESRGFGDGGRRRDELDFFEKDNYWDHDNAVPSYDYNHGMGTALKSTSKVSFLDRLAQVKE